MKKKKCLYIFIHIHIFLYTRICGRFFLPIFVISLSVISSNIYIDVYMCVCLSAYAHSWVVAVSVWNCMRMYYVYITYMEWTCVKGPMNGLTYAFMNLYGHSYIYKCIVFVYKCYCIKSLSLSLFSLTLAFFYPKNRWFGIELNHPEAQILFVRSSSTRFEIREYTQRE